MMDKFKVNLTRGLVEELDRQLKYLIEQTPASVYDAFFLATLAQIAEKTNDLLGDFKTIKRSYSFSLKPAQAFAIVILQQDYITDTTSYIGNKLHQLSNEIKKQYA